ncbi:MAG: T9SS type A sorting domain-containing protein [Crocinitomicaceae bacterium]|nr:T9SS type A sorting domain-containing protein [Crocinitomicaceae bacterium]
MYPYNYEAKDDIIVNNPTNDGFYIKGLPQGEVAIYSISGQYIKYQKFDAQTKIDLSEMESCVYLVQVEGCGVYFQDGLSFGGFSYFQN